MRRVAAVLGALWLCGMPLRGQTIGIDTATAQYRAQPVLVDSLARRVGVWAGRLRLFDWRITVRADTLDDSAARTYANPDYRLTLVVMDLRNARQWRSEMMIVHELLHAKIAAYTTTARFLTGGHTVLVTELQRREEALVTDLTTAILAIYQEAS